MRKAFCTFGVGPYAEVLDVARPTFEKYCDLHGYQYFEQYPRIMGKLERPPAWGKVYMMMELLEDYDVVLWIDCDVLILKFDIDIDDCVPLEDIQAIVKHQSGEAQIPSTGFWYARHEMIPYLEKIWSMEKFIHHQWWEQGAFQNLLGYDQDLAYLLARPRRVRETELYHKTYILSEEWNSVDNENLNSEARVMHFPSHDAHLRANLMRKWLAHEEDKSSGKCMQVKKDMDNDEQRNPGTDNGIGEFGSREAEDPGQVRLHAN